jgi:hypothetical protein
LLEALYVTDGTASEVVRQALGFLGVRGAELDEGKDAGLADGCEAGAVGGVVAAAVAASGEQMHRNLTKT